MVVQGYYSRWNLILPASRQNIVYRPAKSKVKNKIINFGDVTEKKVKRLKFLTCNWHVYKVFSDETDYYRYEWYFP